MASVEKSTSRINKRETRPPSDKKLLRGCEEISSSSSCGGEEDHSPALNGHDIQSLAITAQDLERVLVGTQGMVLLHSILGSLEDFRTEMQLRGETELVQRIPDRQERPPLWVEDENDDNKAGVDSEMGRGHQSYALQNWCPT